MRLVCRAVERANDDADTRKRGAGHRIEHTTVEPHVAGWDRRRQRNDRRDRRDTDPARAGATAPASAATAATVIVPVK